VNFAHFFIRRPIFAAVLSIFIVLVGVIALFELPIAQYPEIAPPQVQVAAVYPGASADVLEKTVAAPLETQINGVEGMLYMNSTSASNGRVEITVTFEIGTDIDQAVINVNNRVKQAEARLPQEVRRQGLQVEKASASFLQVLAFTSPDGRYDDLFTSNYVTLNVLDVLKRVPGTTSRCRFQTSVSSTQKPLYRSGLTTSNLMAFAPSLAAETTVPVEYAAPLGETLKIRQGENVVSLMKLLPPTVVPRVWDSKLPSEIKAGEVTTSNVLVALVGS